MTGPQVLCAVAMFAISPFNALLTVCIVGAVFVYLSFAVTQDKTAQDWGEAEQGLLGRWVLRFLLRMDVRKQHVKFWRPQLLCMLPPAYEVSAINRTSHCAAQ